MNIIIREAAERDSEVIIGFQKQMAKETEELILDSDTIFKGVHAVFNDAGKGKYFVAEESGKIIASLMITFEWSDWRNSNVWWFQSVYVLPEFRRHGVFRKMYTHVRELALSSGVAGLRLYVESNNNRAHLTYEAMGMNSDHYRMYEWLR
ncbi:MAG TPA: GNAT family N-acetyltransferase [Bacteroidales bacterium]|nr:GNAT family N-acetyltransferase [Bacteroidales bacterium]